MPVLDCFLAQAGYSQGRERPSSLPDIPLFFNSGVKSVKPVHNMTASTGSTVGPWEAGRATYLQRWAGRHVQGGRGSSLHTQEASMRLISPIFSQRMTLRRASFSHISPKNGPKTRLVVPHFLPKDGPKTRLVVPHSSQRMTLRRASLCLSTTLGIPYIPTVVHTYQTSLYASLGWVYTLIIPPFMPPWVGTYPGILASLGVKRGLNPGIIASLGVKRGVQRCIYASLGVKRGVQRCVLASLGVRRRCTTVCTSLPGCMREGVHNGENSPPGYEGRCAQR